MEKLNSEKFQTLSNEEMQKVDGGLWGWVAQTSKCTLDGGSVTHFHHYNIWGNYDGGYMNVKD